MGFHCSEHMSLVFKRRSYYFDQVAFTPLEHSPPPLFQNRGSTLIKVSNRGVVSSPNHAHHKRRKMSGDFLDSFEFTTGHGTCLKKASGTASSMAMFVPCLQQKVLFSSKEVKAEAQLQS